MYIKGLFHQVLADIFRVTSNFDSLVTKKCWSLFSFWNNHHSGSNIRLSLNINNVINTFFSEPCNTISIVPTKVYNLGGEMPEIGLVPSHKNYTFKCVGKYEFRGSNIVTRDQASGLCVNGHFKGVPSCVPSKNQHYITTVKFRY